ncbi:hypothetical protein FOZG_16627 [Fusarium oxysporum Fo47]|uniref:Uncharacterized protein n=1 Tax=Fusarium oxysporum Fo47 TaxID=660027 RepID=W9JK42_FUSOX|nr:hypothetical protein FOZG_16627 [Fusarium oxysporum Fo47]
MNLCSVCKESFAWTAAKNDPSRQSSKAIILLTETGCMRSSKAATFVPCCTIRLHQESLFTLRSLISESSGTRAGALQRQRLWIAFVYGHSLLFPTDTQFSGLSWKPMRQRKVSKARYQ